MKIKINLLLKINLVIIFVAIFLVTAFTTVFLYNNFYQTITQATTISKLKTEFAIEAVGIEIFNKVKQNLQLKTSRPSPNFDAFKNPFAGIDLSTASPNTKP
jgi:hypothetical protein